MDMPAVSGSSLAQTGTRNPQPRTNADFAAAFAAAAQTSETAPARVRSPLLAAKLILPTRQNVQQLASALGQKLSARFGAAGLAKTPAVSFSVDSAGGIHVSGARSDLASVEKMILSDSDLQRAIRDTNAIASHAYEIENGGHLQFQRAYRLSSDPQEIVAQYAYLFGGRPRTTTTSVAFSGGAVSVLADGQNWVSG